MNGFPNVTVCFTRSLARFVFVYEAMVSVHVIIVHSLRFVSCRLFIRGGGGDKESTGVLGSVPVS